MPTSPSPIQRLNDHLKEAQAELQTQQAELEAKERRARDLQVRHDTLSRSLELAEDRLHTAEAQFSILQHQHAGMEQVFGSRWGLKDGWGSVLPLPLSSYVEFMGIEAAIADYKRVRPLLQAAVTEAQGALQKFEQDL
jgi:hypothetical protein